MLIPVLFLLLFIFMICSATLDIGVITARVALTQRANTYADVGISRAISNYDDYVRDMVSYYGPQVVVANSFPQPPGFVGVSIPVCSVPGTRTDDLCPFYYFVTIQQGRSTTTNQGNDPSNQLQANYANEDKFSVAIEVDVQGRNKDRAAPLARRVNYLTYRVYNNAPYATLVGSRSVDTNIPGASGGPGDISGLYDAASAAPSAAPVDDTRIHTQTWCTQIGQQVRGDMTATAKTGGAHSEGLPWGNVNNAAFELPCLQSSATPTDAYQQRLWNPGFNANAGWSP